MSENRLVNYDMRTNILEINKTLFDLNSYTVEQPRDIRKQIGKISIENKLVSDFYNGETNEYYVQKKQESNDDLTNNDDLTKRVDKINKILIDLKLVSKETVLQMTRAVNANVLFDENIFTKFVAVVMLATRVLTSVLILQKVNQAKCELPTKHDELDELERKIKKLENLLLGTSNLLFMMETIQY